MDMTAYRLTLPEPKFYVCVEEYITMEDTHERSTNAFLDNVSFNRPRDSYYNYYDVYGYSVPKPTRPPKFEVGKIYSDGYVSGSLVDDEGKVIFDADFSKFAKLNFKFGEDTNNRIKKFIDNSVNVEVKPYAIDFDKEEYSRTKDLSKFRVWFKVGLYCRYCAVEVVDTYYDGDSSIDKALYAAWKDARMKSPQVAIIQRALDRMNPKPQKLHHTSWSEWISNDYFSSIRRANWI